MLVSSNRPTDEKTTRSLQRPSGRRPVWEFLEAFPAVSDFERVICTLRFHQEYAQGRVQFFFLVINRRSRKLPRRDYSQRLATSLVNNAREMWVILWGLQR